MCTCMCQLPMISNLMYAIGNVDYADSQRQAAITLQVFLLLVVRTSFA